MSLLTFKHLKKSLHMLQMCRAKCLNEEEVSDTKLFKKDLIVIRRCGKAV